MKRSLLALPLLYALSPSANAQSNVLNKFEAVYEQGKECALMEKVINAGIKAAGYERSMNDNIRGFFPLRQTNTLQLIFWQQNKAFPVRSSVSFSDERLADPVLDTVQRMFTPLERGVFKMADKAIRDNSGDPAVIDVPNTEQVMIPIVTAYGNKVYIMYRAKEKGIYLFGNDYEYRFEDDWQTFTKEKLHPHVSAVCSARYKSRPDEVMVLLKQEQTNDELTVKDFATMLFYNDRADWDKLLLFNKRSGYLFAFKDHSLTRLNKRDLREIQQPNGATDFINANLLF